MFKKKRLDSDGVSSLSVSEIRTRSLKLEGESYQQREQKMMKDVEKIIESFLKASQMGDSKDWAILNDIVLRYFFTLPLKMRHTVEDRNIIYSKLERRAAEFLRQKLVERDLFERNIPPEHLAEQDHTVEFAELAHQFGTLYSSVEQLVRFISSQSEKNPDRIFATSIPLDVFYGIDLLTVDPSFDEERMKLSLRITGYQAKASRVGLSEESIRELPERYQHNKDRLERDVELDPDWIKTVLMENRSISFVEMDDQKMHKLVSGELKHLDVIRTFLSDVDPITRFSAQIKIHTILSQFTQTLGISLPENIKVPRIEILSFDLRYLVDTPQGTKNLSEKQARQFKVA